MICVLLSVKMLDIGKGGVNGWEIGSPHQELPGLQEALAGFAVLAAQMAGLGQGETTDTPPHPRLSLHPPDCW